MLEGTMKIEQLQVGPIGTNCYILCDEAQKVCAVIDPGGAPARVAAAVEAAGCVPCAILLTHGHYDHMGGAADLREKWPEVPVYLNHRDVYGEDAYLRQLFPAVPGALDYDEGDTLAVGALTVSVLATPGHSEGSVTLRCENVLFCGDTLFAGSCGRTDFPGGSMEKIMASLKRLGRLEGDLAVYPGHMESSSLDRERQWNPYLLQALGQN
jgi:glyoxylase-like metal-dependent hydrolase (beta-lactamase superfamily II)